MKKLKIPIFFLILLISSRLLAIEVESYVDKTKIGIQDYLNYTIEISGSDLKDISPPDISRIKDFRNLGSSTSTQESISIVNSRIQKTRTMSFTYRLKPKKTGNFIIPPISFRYDSKTYTTSAVRIYVVKGTTDKLPPSRFDQSNNQQESQDVSDNLFLETVFDKRSVYQDEPLKVDYYLFTRYDISNISFGDEPNFKGFWKEDVYMPTQIAFKRTTRNGVLFNRMLIRSIALFPNETGNIRIPELELVVDIRTRSRSFFDFGETKRLTITSNPQNIIVKELPQEGKPEDFSGAVGEFSIKSAITTTDLKVGESFTYTLTLDGRGNLNHIEMPNLPEFRHLRFFEPEIISEMNQDKISGKKIIKYLVVAQEKGDFTIPAMKFSFFDVNRSTYRTLKTDTYRIQVVEGEGNIIPTGTAQSIVELEGKDIGFVIKNIDFSESNHLFSRPYFWIVWILLLFSIPLLQIYAREKIKLDENIDYLRQKKARQILKKYMKKASEAARDDKIDFYTAAQRGLSSYLADKLKLNRGSISETIIKELEKRETNQQLLEKIKALIERCNEARFMPGGFSSENIRDDYQILKNIITELSRSKL